MNKTEEMKERESALNVEWNDIGNGYSALGGHVFSKVIYIALPENHPLINEDTFRNPIFDELDVNGGLTFHEGNVFGWDYAHELNVLENKRCSADDSIKDFDNALAFFKKYETLDKLK